MSTRTQDVRKRFTLLVAVGVLAAAICLAAPLGASRARAQEDLPCAEGGMAPAAASMHVLRSSVLCLINRAREHFGLAPLSYNVDLRNSATGHSRDMVEHEYFSHYGSHGSTIGARVAGAGYLFRATTYLVGENIGYGLGRRFGSPVAIFDAWMHSAPHRSAILDPKFHDFGVGVALGAPDGGKRDANAATYTLDFGMRR